MKSFEEHKQEAFDKFSDAGELGILTTADFYAIQAMLDQLKKAIEAK